MDARAIRLAEIVTDHSIRVQKGELAIIDTDAPDSAICRAVTEEIQRRGGHVYVIVRDYAATRRMLKDAPPWQVKLWRDSEMMLTQRAHSYVLLNGGGNARELAGLSPEAMCLYMNEYRKPLAELRQQRKWLVMRLPTGYEAQAAGMDTDTYEDFYYKACTVDYAKMKLAMENLVGRMHRTDRVHITGPGTDLSFSIKDIPAIKAAGAVNLPDGEVYTAPVKTSINGTVHFNTAAYYQGKVFQNVCLTFKNGKVVNAACNDTTALGTILDTDEGARYVGEFAFGLNPCISSPVGTVLFDEKINGSFHLALGNAYDIADNGVRSSIHWDIVCIQRPEWGGGEIAFDGVPIMRDGRFVQADLEALNPENLTN